MLACSGEGRDYLMKQMMVMLILTLLVSSVGAEIFRDNFNDGDLKGWTFVQGDEDGGIENGELVLGAPKAELGQEIIIAVDDIISSDYEVSVSAKISWIARNAINSGATLGLRAHTDPLLKQSKDLSLLYERAYKFVLGNNMTPNHGIRKGLAATIRFMKVSVEGNVWTILTGIEKLHTFSLFNFKLHKWYRLKIVAKGNRFQCFIDDKEMLDFLDDTYTEGGIYLSAAKGSRVHFDDFEIQYAALSVQPRKKLTTTWGKIKGDFH